MQHFVACLLYSVLISFSLSATHNVFNAPSKAGDGPFANIQMSADPHQNNSTNLTVKNELQQRAFIDFTSVISTFKSLPVDAFMQASERWYKEGNSFISNNKWPIGLGMVILGYGCFHYTIFQLHSFFNDSQRWANWGPLIEAEDLLTLQPEHLEQELLLEIQRRYINAENPTDFISPLISFLNEIEHEQKLAQRYLTISLWLEKIHIQYYLPFRLRTSEIKLQAQRLVHIKHTFHNWAAHHKIALTKKELVTKRNKQFPQESFVSKCVAYGKKSLIL